MNATKPGGPAFWRCLDWILALVLGACVLCALGRGAALNADQVPPAPRTAVSDLEAWLAGDAGPSR